jgi:DNA-binding CsgD family transcriptional regulator
MTPRQVDVASLIVKGHSSKEIGRLIDISPLTVAKHRRDIFAHLAVRSAAELCLRARSLQRRTTTSE